jgi:hypothetical protein
MMSLQVAPETNLIYDKIWKMFDDCIKTNRFSKVQNLLCVGSKERCAVGLIMSYTGVISPHGKIIDEDIFLECIRPYYKMVSIGSDSEINRIENLKDRDVLLKELKDYYHKTGTIRSGYITQLNDQTDFSFEEFRDLFKEIDV